METELNNLLILSEYIVVELSAFSSEIFIKSSLSTEKWSRIKFSQSNLDQSLPWIFDLLPNILPNILGTIAIWGRWSDVVAVKLPNIMSGSILFENILSIRVLEESLTIHLPDYAHYNSIG